MPTPAELFDQIFKNLKVSNYQEIAMRRDEITKALNGLFAFEGVGVVGGVGRVVVV